MCDQGAALEQWGASFDGDPLTVATVNFDDLSVAEQPGIAVGPSGTVLVSFSSVRTPPAPGCARDLDAFVARSTDRGSRWSAPVRLGDDACTAGATQRNPWVAFAPNGRADAVFYDNRDDTSDPRTLYGVRYTNSTDDGQSFGPNARINDVDFDTTDLFTPRPSGFQSNEFDQVNGIASTDDGAIAAWGDTRGRAAPGQAATRSDVFSARTGSGSGSGSGFRPGPGPRPESWPATGDLRHGPLRGQARAAARSSAALRPAAGRSRADHRPRVRRRTRELSSRRAY